ncbi:PHP domain-containing protein [Fusobacterium ulcerans]|uniref:Histidinol-phosphatase n=1 Tax=Fusobacterium ulcerans TaxID=861 RepID=A0AAX2J9R4_9FUSO|nr:histidinol-phosphatase HisJ family protein [Fusobacterium ulcerans]AVQ28892.1 PHP domain-containing protein [Fusobacterium ulcerans]EFS26376.1 histidinol phosphate phosphatase HisJ family protein [Fusobacterium ulcerans ATCC 49185]SQJ01102.1 histidinol-phosphatase [Fusobacterium ulcerans]
MGNIISDYHVHSEFSGDSTQDMEEIIQKAISLGLQEIALTDHLEYDIEGMTDRWVLKVDKYVKRVLELKEKYKKEIDVKLGVEVGVQTHTREYLEGVVSSYPFDFVINSSHAINRIDLAFGEIQEGKTKEEVQALYFDNVLKNVELYDKFNVYGHLDFVTRYGGPKYRGLNYKENFDRIDAVLKKLIEKGKGIEINTSGFRYKEDRFYPCADIVKRYYELGGEILTIGSDAHVKEYLTMDFKLVYDFMESIDKKYITSFKGMQPIFKKIK